MGAVTSKDGTTGSRSRSAYRRSSPPAVAGPEAMAHTTAYDPTITGALAEHFS